MALHLGRLLVLVQYRAGKSTLRCRGRLVLIGVWLPVRRRNLRVIMFLVLCYRG